MLLEEIPVNQNVSETDRLQVVDPSEVVLAVLWILLEVVVEHISLLRELLRHRSQHLHEQGQMIIVLLVLLARSRVKEEVSG